MELITRLTPTRSDDEILAPIERYALSLLLTSARPLTDAERAAALSRGCHDLVKKELGGSVADNVIDLTTQLAYSASKADQAPPPSTMIPVFTVSTIPTGA